MKTTHVIDLLRRKEKPAKITNSLRIAGFSASDIVTEENQKEAFLLSVLVKDEIENSMVTNIFDFYRVQHVENFDLHISNGDELRRILETKAKIEIRNPKQIRNHNHFHPGINSEVSFGRS